MESIDQLAREKFDVDYLYPYQRFAIYKLLAIQGFWGKELEEESLGINLILYPTGSGKSLCFMLPGLLLEKPTLMVYPLLSLMNDQYRRLEEQGIPAAILRGGQSPREKSSLQRKWEEGSLKFLLTNPEMCQSPWLKEKILQGGFSQIILDEVHTILQWGKTFRSSMLELQDILDPAYFKGIHFFTATLAEREVDELKSLLIPQWSWQVIRSPGDRQNLSYYFLPVPRMDIALVEICRNRSGPVLVFCKSRRESELTAVFLRRRLKEEDIFYYHAGLPRKIKEEREAHYMHSPRGILCATCAYGIP